MNADNYVVAIRAILNGALAVANPIDSNPAVWDAAGAAIVELTEKWDWATTS